MLSSRGEQRLLFVGSAQASHVSLTLRSSSVRTCVSSLCMRAQSCLTLCDSVDGSPPGSSVNQILQAKIPEWVAMPFFRGSFPTQGWNPCLLHGRHIYHLSHHGSPDKGKDIIWLRMRAIVMGSKVQEFEKKKKKQDLIQRLRKKLHEMSGWSKCPRNWKQRRVPWGFTLPKLDAL